MVCRDKGRHWSDAAASQGMPKLASKHQILGRTIKGFPQISEAA
jgi:hypothetical protein